MLPAETFGIRRGLLALSLAIPRQEAKAVFETDKISFMNTYVT